MSEKAKQIVLDHGQKGAALREAFFRDHHEKIVEISREMAVCLAQGGKLLFCGNGGSAADSQHLAAEFVNRFQLERPPLPALALTTDTSILTAIGNDYDFDQIYLKQVQAFGLEGDILIGISTSGNSKNIITALEWAKDNGLKTVGLLGKNGGGMMRFCQQAIVIEHGDTPMIQEIQIAVGHMFCRLVDYFLFEAVAELNPYLHPSAADKA